VISDEAVPLPITKKAAAFAAVEGRKALKTLFRLFGLCVLLSGWSIAALCLHVVRIPSDYDSSKSQFVVLTKYHLGILDTYVDARSWTRDDISKHTIVISRIIDAGDADKLKFLADPKSSQSVQMQLTEMLVNDKSPSVNNAIVGNDLAKWKENLNNRAHEPIMVEMTF
jgi:hypothetical protein